MFTLFAKGAARQTEQGLADLKTLVAFKKKLARLGHFHTEYSGIEHLKRHFSDQLERLLREGKL